MTAVVFVGALVAVTGPLAVLARRRLIRERRLAALRDMFDQVRRQVEEVARRFGEAVLPVMRSVVAVFNNLNEIPELRAAIEAARKDHQ